MRVMQPARTPATAAAVDIVVPVHNEEKDLEWSVRRLRRYLDERFPFAATIVIADNASTDSTLDIARRLQAQLDGVQAVHLAEKGRGRALARAWLESGSEVVAYMDVDLSTDLDALLPLVAPLLSGHSDVAIGSRLSAGARVRRGPRRELLSRTYNLLLRLSLGVSFHDAQCGFKALRRDAARRLLPEVENGNWFFDTELLVLAERAGLRIHEVPVDWTDDPDSRVDVGATIREDLGGLWRLWRRPPVGAAPRLHTFGLSGLLSTVAYGLLYWLLRNALEPVPANALSLLLTAVASTAAKRRVTFGVAGATGLARDGTAGLLGFGVALLTTSAAIAWLHAAAPEASRGLELAVLLTANLVATALGFGLLRFAVVRSRREAPAAA
jgi:glycosyltransferase involved in cell wall biosynthesis